MSLGETQLRPTAMLFRNLASMDVEESIRGNPIDGVVLLMGCDKTTPSLLMGAASLRPADDRPLRRPDADRQIPAATTSARAPASGRCLNKCAPATMTLEEFIEAESCMHRSKGHCMTMGTASTMASMVEALGMGLPRQRSDSRSRCAASARSRK